MVTATNKFRHTFIVFKAGVIGVDQRQIIIVGKINYILKIKLDGRGFFGFFQRRQVEVFDTITEIKGIRSDGGGQYYLTFR